MSDEEIESLIDENTRMLFGETIANPALTVLDIERFAKAGVIDGFVQAKMCVWEETDDVMAEDGRIDLAKYTEKAKTQYVIRRDHSSNMKRLVTGAAKYREIADRFGLDFYSEIQWETHQPAEAYVKGAKAVYAAGASRMALWDCYPCRVQILGEWVATSRLGKAEDVQAMTDDMQAYHKIKPLNIFMMINLS